MKSISRNYHSRTALAVCMAIVLMNSSICTAQTEMGSSPTDRLQAFSEAPRPSHPDFSGVWILNAKASDDPLEKLKEAMQASRQARDGGSGGMAGRGGMGRGGGAGRGGMSSGRQGGGGMKGDGRLSIVEWLALLSPAQQLHISHQDPMLLIANENDQRQRLFTDLRGASVSASGGLQQRVSIAGWEGAVLVVETTVRDKMILQSYQMDRGTRQLVVSTTSRISDDQSVSYRLVFDILSDLNAGDSQSKGTHSATSQVD